ncbi:MAG TPA: hypothetical protein EYQ31_11490, partial [Candidatus Handelsmanbacteria bacterium]|nr:hypothetical protein [Candidatus Handelsmanbacteria bacterium]
MVHHLHETVNHNLEHTFPLFGAAHRRVPVDTTLGLLVDTVAELGLTDRTLFVVTSDHGEGLGSHGWPLHGSRLYDEQLRVPLIVHDTGGSLDGLRIDALHRDLARHRHGARRRGGLWRRDRQLGVVHRPARQYRL